MELIELQRLFYDALFEKNAVSTQKLSQHIKAAKELTPIQGLAVYRGSVAGKLSRTLRSIYPVCCRLVGEKFFDATAVTYIRRFPSLSPDLGDYGEQFPDFLANFEPVAKLPYLPDVARLEWHWHRVFNGKDVTGLDLQALSEVPQEKWGELIFHLPKNSVLLESPYPIHRIWQVNQSDYEGQDQVSLNEGGIKIFLWRQGYDMRIDLPTDAEWQLLKAFQAENLFEIVCEDLAADEPAIDVASLLPLFVQRGWVAGFSLTHR
ncbi:MAG: putative DNA-binding domain-containing protein [Xenococcaceae cyanobacterium]